MAQATPPVIFLDLTTPEVRLMDRAKTVGCGGFGATFSTAVPYHPPQLTLALEIARLNQDNFRLGEDVVCDVRMINTGDKSILLPWNPDSDTVYGKDCRGLGMSTPALSLEGSLGLKVIDPAGRTKFVGGHRLFALSGDTATLRALAPGQSACIRVSGSMDVPQVPTNSSLPKPAIHFKLIAVFDLRDSSLPNAYQTVVSTNDRRVTIAGR
jgi:hypothetical protein